MRLTQILSRARWELVPGVVSKSTEKYSNLPKSYIRRAMRQIEWQTPRGNPRYLPRTIEKKRFRFSTHRPWTREFWEDNHPGHRFPQEYVEPLEKWSFFRGDRVEIVSGADKGKQGIVSSVYEERNWVIVEGLNWKLKEQTFNDDDPPVMVREEQPLLVTTEVKLVDPGDFQPTEFEWRYSEDGKQIRVSLRTGREIPIPQSAEETYDYKSPETYFERAKDTKAAEVEKVTFFPKLRTFEMDIMETMGIQEDRKPTKTYWY